MTNARGEVTTYTYNSGHLVTEVNAVFTGTATVNISFAYDAVGNRTLMTDGQGSTAYAYDQLSNLLSENRHFTNVSNPSSTDHNYKLTYTYSISGEMTSLTDPFGVTVNYAHDTAGRLSGVTGNYGTVTSYAGNIGYRASGAVKSASFGNGSSETISYTSRMQPSQFRLMNGSTNLLREDYSYFSDGKLAYIHDLDDTQGTHAPDTIRFMSRRFAYDNAGRTLNGYSDNTNSPPFGQTYSYDSFNNLTGRSGYYNWESPSIQSDSATYSNNKRNGWTYDADGRLTVSPANSSSRTAGERCR